MRKKTGKRAAGLAAALLIISALASCASGTETGQTQSSGTLSTVITTKEDRSGDSSGSDQEPVEKKSAGEETGSSSGQDAAAASSTLVTAPSDLEYASMFTDRDLNTSWSAGGSKSIVLQGESVETKGTGISTEESAVVISEEGTYHLTGTLSDGQIIVNTDENEKVQLVLDNVDITCSTSACILIKSADKVFVTLADGSENTLSDRGIAYVQPDDTMNVDAVFFTKSDTVFNGSGSLTVNAGYQDGIVGKDDLKFTGGTFVVNAAGKGIVGKDSLRIRDGSFTVVSEDDALHSSNDEKAGKGYVYIEGGTFSLSTGDDGIHAATALVIENGTIDILKSYEGLEGDTIDIDGGTVRVTAQDDGLNASLPSSSGNTDENGFAGAGGTDMPATPQDAAGAGHVGGRRHGGMRGAIAGQSGTDAPAMPEGFAGQGRTDLPEAPEDFAGQDGTGMAAGRGGMDRGMQGGFGMMDVQSDACIHITGGNLYVSAEGDGIDSNGTIVIDGGTIVVDGPTGDGNGAIDCGVEAIVNGGTVLAAGSAGMAETFSENSTQYSVLYNFSQNMEAGTEIVLLDENGKSVISFTPSKVYSSVVLSSPDMKEGTYTLRAGEAEAEIEISAISTTAGASSGMMQGEE